MDINRIPLFAMINRNMSWLTRNHQLLAENVSNADTPNYQAKHLKPLDFDRQLRLQAQQVILERTHDNHITTRKSAGSIFDQEAMRDPYEVTPIGNEVSLDQQAVMISKNAMDYSLASTLYGKTLGMLRMAINNR